MSLKSQIIIIFISIMIGTIGISSFIYYYTAKKELLAQIYNNVEAVSESKKQRLLSLINKRQEQVVLIQIRDVFTENYAEFLNNQNQDVKHELQRALEVMRNKIPAYKEAHLLSTKGIVMVSSSKSLEGADLSDRISFTHALKGEICLHDIFYDENKDLHLNVAGRLFSEGKLIGLLVIDTDGHGILELIQDYTGLGSTGETTLARKLDSGETYYITPTRFLPIPGEHIIRPKESKYAMARAFSGVEELLVDGVVDYREEPVIAYTRYVSKIGWALTTKIDKKEALAPVNYLLWETLTLALILIGLIGFLAYIFAERLTRPILNLCSISNKIAEGDLDKRLIYTKNNELGQLAVNFNLMADKLVETNKNLHYKIEEMDRANDSLNRFAYIISHDLKSPLSSVIALLSYMKKGVESCADPEMLKMLDMIDFKTKHMQELIEGILQYSVSDITKEEKKPVDVNALILDIIRHLEVPAHIEITLEALPVVIIEKVLLLQVFQNLIGNSIKYMDKPKGWVKIGYVQVEDKYQFYVMDNGRGIAKRHFEKIFDIFNKTHQLKGIDSSGLGLSIVKKIVESKGGRIWVESEIGEGSTFYFTIL